MFQIRLSIVFNFHCNNNELKKYQQGSFHLKNKNIKVSQILLQVQGVQYKQCSKVFTKMCQLSV